MLEARFFPDGEPVEIPSSIDPTPRKAGISMEVEALNGYLVEDAWGYCSDDDDEGLLIWRAKDPQGLAGWCTLRLDFCPECCGK